MKTQSFKRGTGFCAWHAACDRNSDLRCQDDPHLATALVAGPSGGWGHHLCHARAARGMRTARLAGVAPVAGQYTAIGAMIGYALLWEFTTSDDW